MVEAVLRHLEDSCIFPPDHGFMRRIAYVETRDGTNIIESTYVNMVHNRIGIWGLTEYKLHLMRHRLKVHSNDTEKRKLIADSQRIYRTFGVNMTGDATLNMRIPLVSGIAARFYLHYLTVLINVELSENLTRQANFWASNYNFDANATLFNHSLMELKGINKM